MNSMTEQDIDPRVEYIAGLRAIADLLEAHPDLPLPYSAGTGDKFDSDRMRFFFETKEQTVAFARAFPSRLDKQVDEDSEVYGFELKGSLRGLHVLGAVDRNVICERRVIGTREVTETVPDPSVSVPLVEVTKTVEDVEWVCSPLLASVTS